MNWVNLRIAIGISATILITDGAMTEAFSQVGHNTELTPQEIITKSENTYASLSSYSDEGKTTSVLGSTLIDPHIFTIKLARPNLYRIEWKQDSGAYINQGAVYSSGKGDFLKASFNKTPEKCSDMESALSGATGISGGAAGSIPGTFFNLNWGNQLGKSMQAATRKGDEKIADVDCYVLRKGHGGRTRTLWIGKTDFLIHQVEDDTSAAELKKLLEDQAKTHPEMNLPTGVAGDSKSIQTHLKIVINKPIPAVDFDSPASANSEP